MRALLVPPAIGRVAFDARKSAWLALVVLLGAMAPFVATPALIVSSIALTILTVGLGHSVGLHRGVIHRAYRTSRLTRRVLLYLFVQTGLGGPISWMRLHRVRDYWQNEPECPPYFAYRHSLLRDFGWNQLCSFHPRDEARYGFPMREERDPWIRFLQRTWVLHPLGLALAITLLFGFEAAIVLVFARVAITILGHWFVGYVSHTAGEKRWAIEGSQEEGRNTLLLGWLSFGEGFHNNHHAHPRSARIGFEWWELDLGWLLLRALEKAGLVWRVRAYGRAPTLREGAHELRTRVEARES